MVRSAAVVFDDETRAGEDLLKLRPGTNFLTGEDRFRSRYGEPASLEVDVLTAASAIFACDLALKRDERSNFHRQIHLTVLVTNRPAFLNVADDLRFALARVSNDAWSLDFFQEDGVPEHGRMWLQDKEGKVLLFSGGLDSIAAAIMYGEAEERVYLTSHFTNNQAVKGAQQSAHGYLGERFPSRFTYLPFRVSGRDRPADGFHFPREREETQRTRSVLFLALAALVARREGVKDVVVIGERADGRAPSPQRRQDRRLLHPHRPSRVREIMGDVLSALLNHPIRIENPFLYMTKAEVVVATVERHRPVVEGTVSC